MDIFALVSADTAAITSRVELGTDPATGNAFGVLVVGVDSPQYAAEKHRQELAAQKYRREANKNPALKIDMDTEEGQAKYKERFNENINGFACAVSVDWFGFTNKGKAAKFDPEMLRKLIESRPSYRDKIIAATEDSAAFLPKQEKA